MKAKVEEMFTVFQKVFKRKPSDHRQYVKTKFLGRRERISWNWLKKKLVKALSQAPKIQSWGKPCLLNHIHIYS